MAEFSVGGGALLDRPCIWSYKECACCACDPSVHLCVPSIGFVYVFVCRKFSLYNIGRFYYDKSTKTLYKYSHDRLETHSKHTSSDREREKKGRMAAILFR